MSLIIPRTGPNGWGARRPKCRTAQDPRNVREGFIHWPGQTGVLRLDQINDESECWCALPEEFTDAARIARITTPAQERAYMRGIQDFHMGPSRGWCDFAYSEAVFKSGRIYRGRGIHAVPAGQEGHNSNTWAILCVLGTGDTEVPPAMRASLMKLARHLDGKSRHDVLFRPHRSVNQTTCPGDVLARFTPKLNRV